MQDRNAQYGEPTDTFRVIAALWSAYLEQPITPADAVILVSLLKVARLKANPAHTDSWIDLAGYASIGGELAT